MRFGGRVKRVLILLFFGLIVSDNMFAKNSIFDKNKNSCEVGIVVGKLSGISGKYFVTNIDAIDGAVGFGPDLMVHFDYLRHNFKAYKVTEGELPCYYGGGVFFQKDNICVQLKAGLEYIFETNPLGIFIEIAPAFGNNFVFQGGVGVRYRLK